MVGTVVVVVVVVACSVVVEGVVDIGSVLMILWNRVEVLVVISPISRSRISSTEQFTVNRFSCSLTLFQRLAFPMVERSVVGTEADVVSTDTVPAADLSSRTGGERRD